MKSLGVLVVAVLFSSGCTAWPPHGHGGMAEVAPIHEFDRPTHIRLIAAKREISVLRELGGEDLFPASLIKAQRQWDRSARAIDGHFIEAAKSDLLQLDEMLSDMRAVLSQKLTKTNKLLADQVGEVPK